MRGIGGFCQRFVCRNVHCPPLFCIPSGHEVQLVQRPVVGASRVGTKISCARRHFRASALAAAVWGRRNRFGAHVCEGGGVTGLVMTFRANMQPVRMRPTCFHGEGWAVAFSHYDLSSFEALRHFQAVSLHEVQQ